MGRRLVLGRAGSGKTRIGLEEIARRIDLGTDDGALLLVPTYGRAEHLKRALLRVLEERGTPARGFLDRSIVTFTSLAERVLGGTPIGALVSPGLRDHLLRSVLEEGVARGDAAAFAAVHRFPGFRARFLALVKEVKESGLRGDAAVDAVRDLAAGLPGAAARRRMEAFAAVFAAYEARLAADGRMDHEDFQARLLATLEEDPAGLPPSLGGVEWLGVDGFANFTGLQRRVVDLLAARIPEVVLTVPWDDAREALFRPSEDTRRHLLGGPSPWTPEDAGPPRRFAGGAGDLVRLEETLFRAAPPDPAPPDGSVALLACADAADEADRLARRAALWIRRDGWAPFEILLVRRALAPSRALLEEAFARHGVPLRVFAPRPVLEEPIVRAARDLVRLALGVADGATALRAARSAFTAGVDADEGDRLAERAERRGLPAAPEDLVALAAKERFPATAARLRSLLPPAPADGDDDVDDDGPPFAARPQPPDALWSLALEAVAVPGRLVPSYDDDSIPGDAGRLSRHAAEASALAALQGLLGEVALGLRGAPADGSTPERFAEALDRALSRGTFQPPDRRLHAVNAVDAEEARQWEARGVLLAGLNEKEFPRAPREDLFLRDRDRRAVNEGAGEDDGRPRLRFAERLRGREEERLLFYAACTRARERLVLSWATAGPDGARLLPSSFLDEVARLWPEDARPVSVSDPSDPAPAEGEALSRRDLLRGALVRVAAPFVPGGEGERRARLAAVELDTLARSHPGKRDPFLAAAAARSVDPDGRLRRPRAMARHLRPLRTSASGLATFHQCAYRHFASRVLKLAPPRRADDEGLDAMALGSAVHRALELWFRGERRDDPVALFDAALEEAGLSVRGLDDGNRARRARAALAAFAAAEGLRVDGRPYRPWGFELPFGIGPDDAPALELRVGGRRIAVRGVMDRVDRAPDGRAVAVDYKVSFSRDGRSYGEREHGPALDGVDPQVPLYWLALRRSFGLRPAGVEIADVVKNRVTGLRGADSGADVAPGPKSVELHADGEVAVEAAMTALAERVVHSLVEGRVEPRPFDLRRCGAGNCDYADLCRFDASRGEGEDA